MRPRPPRGAGATGAKHYALLFGEQPPDKKNGRTSKIIEADRNSKQDQHIVSGNIDPGKVPQKWLLG